MANVMKKASRIRKKGESWDASVKRAGKMMKGKKK